MKYLVVIGFFCLGVASAVKNYDGYKVYTVTPKTTAHADILLKLEKPLHLDFWTHPRALDRDATVMVQPSMQELFERTLQIHEVPFKVLITDVERTHNNERIRQSLAPALPKGDVTFTKFMTHAEINSYLETVAKNYSDIVSIEEIGESFEGRSMKLLKISSGPGDKPTIFVDAGIHAREWISEPVALYIINQLVENSTNAALYQNVNWIVLPALNPDGYEYTQSDERFWKKTRSAGKVCDGANADRNFDYHWMEAGADPFECTDIYAGSAPFSEIEAENFRAFLAANNADGGIKLYLTFHSNGPNILHPWGYNFITPTPDNIDELITLGNDVREAILNVSGTDYFVGSSGSDFYPAAGASVDWCYANNVTLAYTVELPGGGMWGFNPPASDILPIVRETWVGIKVFHKHIEDNYSETEDMI